MNKQIELERDYFGDIYNVLVFDAGAPKHMKTAFIEAHITRKNERDICNEWRFQGRFLFGGKYRRDKNSIDYYIEDETTELDILQEEINEKLDKIYFEYKGKGLNLQVY
ncbi:MAG: hypothetical protein PHX80_03900 [Candidatus Nanoarchaeia archaeon]|nr:hypothetical protein [Candidatus Nanoarchaeia archaeon]